MALKVLIVESSSAKDFYNDQLDGPATLQLLKLLDIRADLRLAVNDINFWKALKNGAAGGYDVLHISCHGTKDGLVLADRSEPTWDEFAGQFQKHKLEPKALVMSACCGASSGIGKAFEKVARRPNIIFGSTDERYYHDYAVAWAILYRIFSNDKVSRDAAQIALAHINAVVDPAFRYRRWAEDQGQYLVYPRKSDNFRVINTGDLTKVELKKIDVI